MKQVKRLNNQRIMRARRVRAVIRGTKDRPRLSVFRSNTRLTLQLIDDVAGKTVASATDKKGVASAEKLGKKIAEAAKKAGITVAVFDRGSSRYHGNIKAIAEGARAAGLKL